MAEATLHPELAHLQSQVDDTFDRLLDVETPESDKSHS